MIDRTPWRYKPPKGSGLLRSMVLPGGLSAFPFREMDSGAKFRFLSPSKALWRRPRARTRLE